jgi:hypothetical protein
VLLLGIDLKNHKTSGLFVDSDIGIYETFIQLMSLTQSGRYTSVRFILEVNFNKVEKLDFYGW